MKIALGEKRGHRGSVGVVVPTLGTRPNFLRKCLESIRAAGECHIAIVRPVDTDLGEDVEKLADSFVDDPGSGLAAAINAGISALPRGVLFSTWLGDDDRLTAGSLGVSANAIDAQQAAAVFGQCRYIDADGRQVWLNRSGRWTVPLLLVGPQLVPQPGSLFRRSDFERIGGLNENLKWAFDLDMFLKLRKMPGGLVFVKTPLAEFRWHADSLSVGSRKGSVTEASRVRQGHLPRSLRLASKLWEPVVWRLILIAGNRLSSKMSKD
jgi:hypothetical protein